MKKILLFFILMMPIVANAQVDTVEQKNAYVSDYEYFTVWERFRFSLGMGGYGALTSTSVDGGSYKRNRDFSSSARAFHLGTTFQINPTHALEIQFAGNNYVLNYTDDNMSYSGYSQKNIRVDLGYRLYVINQLHSEKFRVSVYGGTQIVSGKKGPDEVFGKFEDYREDITGVYNTSFNQGVEFLAKAEFLAEWIVYDQWGLGFYISNTWGKNELMNNEFEYQVVDTGESHSVKQSLDGSGMEIGLRVAYEF